MRRTRLLAPALGGLCALLLTTACDPSVAATAGSTVDLAHTTTAGHLPNSATRQASRHRHPSTTRKARKVTATAGDRTTPPSATPPPATPPPATPPPTTPPRTTAPPTITPSKAAAPARISTGTISTGTISTGSTSDGTVSGSTSTGSTTAGPATPAPPLASPPPASTPTSPTTPVTPTVTPPAAGVVTPPGTRPAAGVLWTGDAETGDLSQFQDGPWNDVGGTKPTIVTSPVRDGRYAIQLGISGSTTAADGICCGSRDELLPKFRDLQEGDDLYFGFSTYLAPGFTLDADWQLITQFKENFDGSPPLGLYVEQGQYKVEGGYGYPGGPRQFIKPIAQAATGQWVDWVWHVKFSANPAVGYVEVWKDGTQVLPRFAPASGTLYPGTGSRAGSYLKTGPYRDPSVTTPETMYLDSWRIGTSMAAVAR